MQAAAEPPVVRAAAPAGVRIVHDLAEVAALHRVDLADVHAMIREGEIAYVRIGRRVVVLSGDVFPPGDDGIDGHATLARAWRHRTRLTLHEIAPALCSSVPTLWRLAQRGELPAKHEGRLIFVERDALVLWLRRQRVPARREVAA
jgi:hypothetical protein